MNKPVPWNVKGVGFDAREAARVAARRAGMPVGEWLNSVISERAAALGVRTDDIDPDDRLETIAARLSEVDRGTADRAVPATKSQASSRESSIDRVDPVDDMQPLVRPEADRVNNRRDSTRGNGVLPSAETTARSSSTSRFDSVSTAASRLREAPRDPRVGAKMNEDDADEAPMSVNAAATARLASGAGAAMSASASFEPNRRERRGFGTVQPKPAGRDRAAGDRRVGPIVSRRDAGSQPEPSGGVETERLDTRLASILDKLNRSFEEAERFGKAAAAEPRNRWRAPADIPKDKGQRVFRDSVDAISRRQVALDAPSNGEHAVLDRRGVQDDVRMSQPSPEKTFAAATSRSAESIGRAAGFADLHAAFKTLAEKLDSRLAETSAQNGGGARSGDGSEYRLLKTDIAGLAQRIDRMQANASERDTAASVTADIDLLRQEIAQLSAGLADLAPRRSLESLETALRELAGRVDLSKLDGVQASVLAPVERLSREMREAIRSADPSKMVDGLRREMKALATKVEAIPLQSVDPGILAQVQAETREMRDMLSKASSRFAVTERLEQEIIGLGQRVDQLAERTTPAMSRDLAHAVGDVRTLLEGLDADGVLGAIDRKIDTLAARIDSLSKDQTHGDMFDDLARQIDRAHESLAARLAAREPEPVDLAPLEERIGVLSAKLDTFGHASHDVSALYGLVGGLVDRIDEARNPQADAEILNALQAQIGQLVERLDRSEVSHAMLSGLDRSIGDLFLQIEQSRNIAIDAAENAARTAAQDTLRAAMDNPALNGGELAMQTGLDVDHVSQELSELRRAQEASELRVNATLKALNTTLERLVDRMVSDRTPAPAKDESVAAASLSSETLSDLEVKPPKRRGARGISEQFRALRDDASDQAAFDPDQFLLEPGSSPKPRRTGDRQRGSTDLSPSKAPAIDVGLGPVEEPTADVAPLIAAARRAAQAAQVSAREATLKVQDAPERQAGDLSVSKTRSFFAQKRRPLLLGLASLILLLGTLQIVKLSTEQSPPATPSAKDPGELPSDSKLDAPPSPSPARSDASDAKAPSNEGSLLAPPPSGASVPANFAAPGKSSNASQSFSPTASADASALNGLSQGLRDLASGGNAAAQFEIAVRFSEGRDVTRDAKQAAGWFQRAAQQGLPPAQYRLGSLYEKGIGVSADPALAIAWYERAAGQGNVRAMHNLAVMSAEGTGSKPDYVKAVAWFTKAANYGVRDSQFNLAVLYARGLGVPQSLTQSYAWFAIAADQGDKDALVKRDTVAGKLDPKGLADAKAAVDSFHPMTPAQAANDVTPPPGGWDSVAPAKTAIGPNASKSVARLSSM